MAKIDISRPHSLPLPRARKLLEALAQELSAQFGANYSWVDPGKIIAFEKSGISGNIELLRDTVHITSDLGFLMSPLKGTIERQINIFMDDLLSKEDLKEVAQKTPKAKKVVAGGRPSKKTKKTTNPKIRNAQTD